MNVQVTAASVVLALVVHFGGSHKRLYGSQGGFWWFDHLTHFVSGLAVTAVLSLFLSPLLTIVSFAVCMVLWEVGEYLAGRPKTMWISVRNMVYDFAFSWLACFTLVLLRV